MSKIIDLTGMELTTFNSYLVTVTAPIKDAPSIQKLFFLSSTMTHFAKVCLFLLNMIAQKSEKRTYFW